MDRAARNLLCTSVASILMAIIGWRFGALMSCKSDALTGVTWALDHMTDLSARVNGTHGLALMGLLIGFASAWVTWAALFAKPKSDRQGEEHGSARWATPNEIKAFANNDEPDQNIIFTRDARLAIRRKKFDLVHDRNLNTLVVGGSGSGKTRYYLKPNLMQLYGDYIVTDPKGTLLAECGYLFADNGYEVTCLNTVDFPASSCYNPLRYVKTDAEILSFVNCLIKNTNGKKDDASNDPFWENSEKLLYTSLIAFMRDWLPESEYTLPTLLQLLLMAEAQEDDEAFESPLDLIFKQLETGKSYRQVGQAATEAETYDEFKRGLRSSQPPQDWAWVPSTFVRNSDGLYPYQEGGISPSQDFALSNYKAFKTAAGKTLKSIIISCNVRLKPLEISEISRILSGPIGEDGEPTGDCELRLDKFGDPDSRRVLFGVISDTDKTFAFLLAILMWQSINVLCNKALMEYGGKLPRLVSLQFDEFANIGHVPEIEQTIAVTRSRNIALTIILQSLSQLSNNYTEDASKIIQGNCDTQLFLGRSDHETNKNISEMIGQQTINVRTFNESYGQNGSYTKNYQTQQRALMDASEVGLLPGDKALVLIKGARPFIGRKFILEEHSRYHYIDPGHKPYQNTPALHGKPFDIRKYRERRLEV